MLYRYGPICAGISTNCPNFWGQIVSHDHDIAQCQLELGPVRVLKHDMGPHQRLGETGLYSCIGLEDRKDGHLRVTRTYGER